jgi:hypothetical protein
MKWPPPGVQGAAPPCPGGAGAGSAPPDRVQGNTPYQVPKAPAQRSHRHELVDRYPYQHWPLQGDLGEGPRPPTGLQRAVPPCPGALG